MSNLVFVTGDFCSGSTLMFTLFRHTREYHCLYEPLHERLPEYLIWPLRTYEHHYFADDYFREFKDFRRVGDLFEPRWSTSGLYLDENDRADALYRYLSYLIGASFARSPKVLLKENRFSFRLAWLKARFPSAKIVHIYRRKEDQWGSMVRRGQAALGRSDIGQDSVHFHGFNVARWCEDLQSRYPELAAHRSQTGFERFSKLWEASFAEQQRHADISIDYATLTRAFAATSERLRECVGCEFDLASLGRLVVTDGAATPTGPGSARLGYVRDRIDRVGRRYASFRMRGST
jgi:hypothetical protein